MNKIQRLSITLMMMLMATATWAYTVTMNNNSGVSITAKVGGSDIEYGTTNVVAGQTVTLTVAENANQYLTTLNIQSDVPAGGASAPRRTNSITIQGDVEVRQTGDFTYEFTMPIGNVTITPTFADRMDISSGTYVATITLAESSHVFDWLAHTPVISSVVANSTTLTEGTDYTVSGISAYTNAGTYTITVTGKGKYNGEKTADYTISPRNLAGQTGEGAYPAAMIQLSGTSFVYNNAIQKPTISGVYMNGQTLILDTDYQNVTYSNESSKDKGNYTVTITGKGNFTGNASATYTITQAPISEATFAGTTNFVYSGTVQSPTSFTLTYCGESLTATHYDLSYASGNSTDFSSTCNSTNIGTYKMKITAKDGTNYTGSKEIIYTISSAGPTIFSVGGTEYTGTNIYSTIYTGAEIEPAVVVKDGSGESATTLEEETHYKVIYSDNKNVGTAKISVVGIGVYNFVVETTFKITPKSVSGLTIELSQNSFTYNASTQKPTVTVKDGETTLTENKDYTLVNNGGLNVGTYKATIRGLGNYNDQTTKDSENYSITALTYSNENTTITLGTTNYVYDGTAKEPTVQHVKIGDLVIPSTDYTPEYSNNTAAGTATVTISPKTSDPINLSGSATTTFTISRKPVSDLSITLSATAFTYNGSEQKPSVTVKDGETTLTENTHYTLTWPTASTAVGSYSVTITGINNYTGSVSKTYVINYGTSDSDFTVTVSGTYTYNGTPYTPAGSNVDVTDGSQAVVVKKGTTVLTPTTDYTLSYSNNINAGTATVTATGKGNYQFVQTGTFTIDPKTITDDMATLNSSSFVYNGALQKPIVTITDAYLTKTLVEGTDYTLVNAGGTNVASYNATITGIGNYKTGEEGLAKAYSITALSLTDAVVTLDPLQSYVYDGTEKRPGVQQVKVGNVVVPAADYAVTYPRDNTPASTTNVNAGTSTAKVYINPSGSNLSDSKTQNFSITKKPLTSEMITLSSTATDWQSNSFVYNGTNRTPTVTVSDGSPSIIAASDYTITNAGGTEIGIYYVTVAAKAAGNYSGTIKVPYSIVSDNSETGVTVTLDEGDDLTYTGNPVTRTITVTKGASVLTEGTDFETVYNNNINVGQATITILGKGNYHFVKYAYFNITQRTLEAQSATVTDNYTTITISTNSFEYNGSVQKPDVTVRYTYTKTGEATPTTITLKEGTDYTLSNPGATNVGTAYKAVVTGIGNFTGTMDSPTYKITAKDLTDAVITLYPLANPVYDGTVKEPPVQKVTVGGQVYTSGYTVSYSNNINVGTTTTKPTVTVSSNGTSTFSGSASTTFTINPKPLADDMVTLNTTSYTYDGTAKEPTATVKDTSLPAALQTLTSGTDYTITYSPDHTTPGEKVATITGQGNFKGSVKKTYTIVGASDVTITLPEATYTYNGAEHKPVVTVKKGDDLLTLNTDYTVAYSANINAGIATITVTGIGNYDFTQTKTFTIGKKPMTDAMVTLTGAPFTYNGGVQKPAVTVSDGSPSIISASDYTISNDGNIDAGNYTVTVTATATGNYSGSGSQSYTINPYTLNATNTSVILDQSTFVYDRTAKKPNVLLVKVGDTMVVPTFTTAYSNNVNASNTATVTVTGSGNFTGAVDKTFVITPKSVTSDMIKFDKENFVYDGTNQKPTVTAKDGENTMTPGTDYTLTNEGGTNVGVYYAYIDGKGNYSGRASKPFYIITQNAAAFVVSDIADTEYDGTAKEPVITVTDNTTAPGTVLVKDENYTVSYLNNKDAGIATVIVTGMGSYAGTVTKNFNITPKPLAAEMISVSPGTFTFNGSLQRPDVTVTDGTIMKANDYTVINSGNVNQGTYYVTVIGQGNYKGTITNVAQTKYTITPLSIAEADVNLYELPSYVYDGTAKNPSVREVLVNNYVVPTTGYDVSYGTNIVAGPASITITGKGNFTGTKTVNFTIAQKEITSDMILLSNTEYIYTGELKKPEVTVKQGETTLTLDTDYTLSNNGGIYVGQYDVTVTGKGNYTGTASQTYNIIAQEAGSFVVTLSTESVVYTGGEQKPAVTVKKGDVTLNEGTDYTVMYIDNINVGMATVTVRGKGNYEGTVNKTFFITPKTLTGDMVTLSASSFTYNGVQQRPGVTVSDHDFLTSNDYYITNEGGVNIGPYNVIITGKSNYTGTVTKQFNITPLSLNDANIVLYEMASNIYDGKPKNPGVREVTVGTLVVPTTGYTTSVSPNINVGTVTVTVTGKDNFTGSAETTFVIMPKPLTSSMMTLTPTVFNYNGTVQKPSVTVKDGKVILTEDTDYTLTNEGGKEAGTYEVKVKGIGNYTDEATQSFTILSSGVNTFVVTLEANEYTYNGTAHKPGATVMMNDRTLTEGTDYTLTYSNNTNAGTATVTVKGVGDYTGEQVKTFLIQPKTLTDVMVTLDRTSFIYNEKVQKPEVTVADGTIMTADDYEVTNDGGTTEGTYQVVVTGQNNYKGVVIKSFTITREDIHGDDDPQHPDEKPITYTPTEEGSDEVKVSGIEGTEEELSQVTNVTIPTTFTADGKTYKVVGIAANAFANTPNLTDIYMPDSEEPLVVAEGAIPASVTVHTTLALLDDYALMPSLSESFKAGKIKTTITAKNRYWTFSSGVDVYVPDGVSVYIARERNNATVTIVELSDNDLTVGGQRIIKHNNGVLISSDGNDTPYDLVACGRRMSSGATISTDDFKDYGSQNCLVPVILPTHFGAGYYFLKNNEFYSIQEESEDIKVPAGKAVLYLRQAASSPSYSSIMQLVNTGEVTNINGIEKDADESDWYDMSGRKLDGRPTKKGVYIKNNKKIVIR